jgi:transketolase
MRLSALMGMPVVYVMTHDSIGLGEDGPTHQPVEHLAISRATPNTLDLPPRRSGGNSRSLGTGADRQRRRRCWRCRRQNLPTVRKPHQQNLTAKGGYVLAEATGKRQVILMATGSEVEIALKARAALEAEGIGTRVVSMPSMELFAAQDEAMAQGPARRPGARR